MTTVLLLALLASAPNAAELSYAQALEGALESNPGLVKAKANVASAEGWLLTTQGTFDPSLNLGADHQTSISESFSQFGQVASETDRNGFNTTLSQYLPTGTSLAVDWSVDSSTYLYELLESGMTFEMEDPQRYSTLSANFSQNLLQGIKPSYNLAQVQNAKRGVVSADASLNAARLQAVADTAMAYWYLVYTRDLEVIAQESLAVAEEEGRVVRAMVDAGQLAPVEATRVEAVVVMARSTLIDAVHARMGAGESLAQLMGADPTEPLVPTSEPEPPVAVSLDDPAVVEAALQGNPELQIYRSLVEDEAADLAVAKHSRLPELALTGGFGVNGYDPVFSEAVSEMFSGDLRYWTVGADLVVPLGNRYDRGILLAAEAALVSAEQDLLTAEASVASSVLTQLRAVEDGMVKVELADVNLRLAEITVAAEKAKQREGRAIQKDVLEAMRDLGNAKVEAARARTEYLIAVIELGRLQGRIQGVAQ
jgi:outer membrane protein TolC